MRSTVFSNVIQASSTPSRQGMRVVVSSDTQSRIALKVGAIESRGEFLHKVDFGNETT